MSEATEDTTEPTSAILSRLLGQIGLPDAHALPASSAPACPHARRGEFCDGERHYDGDPDLWRAQPSGSRGRRPALVGECPQKEQEAIAARVTAERARLAPQLLRARGATFEGYDHRRSAKAGQALDLLRVLSEQKPPAHGAILAGMVGLGKTHLLLALHFALLQLGVTSRFVTWHELRPWFVALSGLDAEAHKEAQRALIPLKSAQVVCLDDLGDEGPPWQALAMVAGMKGLVESSRSKWMITTNLTFAEAGAHPEVGAKLLSRLLQDVPKEAVVRMEGQDQRLTKLTQAPRTPLRVAGGR